MFEFHNHAGKRVMAMLLVFAMMFAMLGEYAPSWLRAFAEEISEDSDSSSSEDRSSDDRESSHSDDDSLDSHESSHSDGDSSDSRESSHSDGDSSDSHESSHSDGDSPDSHESSHSDGDSSDSHESSSSEGGSSGGNESSSSDKTAAEDTASDRISEDTSEKQTVFREDAGPENEQNDGSVEYVEATSEGESASEASVVSEVNEESASDDSIPVVVWASSGNDDAADETETGIAPSEETEDSASDDSIPVVVWGSSGDGDAADETETGAAPSGKSAPAEAEGGSTEADTGDSAPSAEIAPLEVAVEEVEVLIGAADPVDVEADEPDDGAASEKITPPEAAVEEVEAFIGTADPVDMEADEPGDGAASEEHTPAVGEGEKSEIGIDGAEADKPDAVLTLTAPLSPAVENSEPAEDEGEAIENGPSLSTQAYTAPVMLAATGAGEEKVCVLQQKINDALQAAGDTLSGRIRVMLEKNTTYDGEVTIDNGGRQVEDDFELEVSSVDAGSDGMQADGSTLFTGNMTIRGISVKISGVGMPGTVTVEGAKSRLVYYGTRADDGANVTVTGSGAQAALHTGEGADSVSAQARDGGQVTVDTGAGADTVTAQAITTGSAKIETGEGEDTVDVSVTGAGSAAEVHSGEGADTVNAQARDGAELTIETGIDSDVINARITEGSSAEIESGAGDDRAEVRVSADSQVNVRAGEGDDVIGLTGVGTGKGRRGTFASVDAGAGDDSVSVAGQSAEEVSGNDRTIAVDLGSGVNRVDVDLSIADVAGKVRVTGGAGRDRLHLTGELDANTAEDQRATGTARSIDLAGVRSRLNIASKGVENITDDLRNKRTVAFEETDSALRVELPFTNYIYRGPLDGTVAFRKAGDDLLLTNVIIAPDDKNSIHVGEDAVISAEGLQLVLHGKTVQVDGTLKAGLVRIEAVDGTDMDALIRVTGQVPMTDIRLNETLSLELLNISDAAGVTLGESARIYSQGDIIVSSGVEQKGGIVNIGDLSQLNLVDLKVARATVDVNGRLYAGYDLNTEKPTDARGSVSLLTHAKTVTGFDENGDPVNGLPFAIALANMDSIINIACGAEIHATDSIRYASNADMRLAARADSSTSLPVAIAAAYVTVDSRVTVNGALEAGRDVTGAASGNVEVTTIADRGDQKSISGGYAGVAVVLQNVKSELGSTAVVVAGRDVDVKSASREKVENLATTGSYDLNSGAPTAVEKVADGAADLFKDAYDLLMKGWNTIKGLFTSTDEDAAERQAAAEELDAAIQKVSVSDHAVSLDEAARVGGDISIKSDKADGRVTNTVTVTPREGYRVKSITWRGLNAGDTRYTYGKTEYDVPDDSARTISFQQSTKNVTVFVEYEEYDVEQSEADGNESDDGAADEEDEEEEEDPFADPEANNSIVVDEMLNQVTSSATDEYTGPANAPMAPAYRTVALTLPVVSEDGQVQGAVLTYDTEEDGACLKTVAPGQELRLVVNPGEGKLLRQGSLKITYKHGDVTERKVIAADDHGRYLITIPKDVDAQEGVSISAEFVDETQTDEAEPQRGTQIAGSAAVTVTENNNTALINSSGENVNTDDGVVEKQVSAQVFAGRDVNVEADSVSDIRGAADGTAVTQNVVTGTQPAEEPDPEEMMGNPTTVDVGEVTLVIPADIQHTAPGELVKISVKRNDDHHIKAGTLKAVLTSADGTYIEEIYLARRSDFTYTFRMPSELPGGLTAEDIAISFVGETAEGATGAGVSTSLGASVALTVALSHNRADIRGAVDAAENVYVTATGDGAARTETRAGYSEGNTGIGGAVSVQVAAMDSRARLHKTAAVQLDGQLKLEAENDAQFYVDADGSGSKRTAKGMGIGAGLAIAVDSAHALAAVEDGATLTGKSDAAIGGLTLNARQRVDDQVSAAAGAGSTGTSLVAALALDFATTSAKAKLGAIEGKALNVRGDVTITADNAVSHTLLTEGSVAGKGTGIGAALALSMVKDKAIATLGENVSAGGRITINAVNESATRNINIASASGGRVPFRLHFGDDIWWKLITATAWLYSIDNTLPKGVANIWIKYHPPGLMTNSSMGIAGAAGANVQTSVAKAEILDGIAVTTAGKLAVTSKNRTEALVKGDASTTESSYGIGIGAGLNIVKMDNIAFVGNGRIKAASLAVTATTKKKEIAFGNDSFGFAAGEEAEKLLADKVGDAVDTYVNDLIREVGLADLPDTIVDSIITPVIESAEEEIMGIAGLGEMFTLGFIDDVAELCKDNSELFKWTGISALALALEMGLIDEEALLGSGEAQKIAEDFVDDLTRGLIVDLRDAVVDTVLHAVWQPFKAIAGKGDIKDTLTSRYFEGVYDNVRENLNGRLKYTIKQLDTALLKDLSVACGLEISDVRIDELMGELNHGKTPMAKLNYVRVAKALFGKEENATSTVGRTVIHTLDEIVDEYGEDTVNNAIRSFDQVLRDSGSDTSIEEETLEGLDEALTVEIDGERYALGDAIIERARKQNVMLTDDQMAVLRNPYDLLAEEDKASAGDHLIDTQVISGAGSESVGVAGAAAVAHLDLNTKAQVGYEKIVVVNPDDIREDYILNVKDYMDKVDKPDSYFSDLTWDAYIQRLQDPIQQYIAAQRERHAQYEPDMAKYKEALEQYEIDARNYWWENALYEQDLRQYKKDYKAYIKDPSNVPKPVKPVEPKEPKKPKKPDKDDYDLSEDEFKKYTEAVGKTFVFDKDDWYDEYQEDLYDEVMDYIKDQYKKDEKYEKDRERYADALVINARHIGEQVNVDGEVLVAADSQRYVNNVASASLNGKGSASANASAADAANSDVGDSSAARNVTQGKTVRMTTDVGATSRIDEADMNKDRPRIYITLREGFELDEEDGKAYADYSFNGEEGGSEGGVEVEGRVELHRDGDKLYIDTAEITGVDADKELYFTLGTREVLRSVAIENPIADGVDVEAGAVSAEVKGRGLNEDDELRARAGDTVVVTINKKDGRRPEYLGYTYTDRSGKTHTVEINPATITGRDLDSYAFAAVTQNKNEIIVSFRMPDTDENGVKIESKFNRYDENPSWLPNYSMKVGVISRNVSGFGRGMGIGASFGMVLGSDETSAVIGHRQLDADGKENSDMIGLTAGSVTVNANSEHREALSSVSGTDPLSGQSTADTLSATSLDASAVVDMLDTSVNAVLDKKNNSLVKGFDVDGRASAGDVTITASEDSETSLNASAFAAGRGTAVGATLALNMAAYAARADIGRVDASGNVTVAADSHSEDTATAVATAVGADVIRILRVAGVDCDPDDEEDVQEKAADAVEGYENDGSEADDGANRDIRNRLNQNSARNKEEDESDGGEETDDGMSLSSNVLRSQGVSTDIPDEEKSDMETTMDGVNLLAQIGLAGGAAYMHIKNFFTASKMQIAASVAVTQAVHTADVTVGGDIHAQGDISATANNTADFNALATAASMSILLKASSVSGGVAVVDNKNEANVTVTGDLVSEKRDDQGDVIGRGDITLHSTLTQNMSESSVNRLAAQSVSGSVAGYGSSAAIGAAVSVVKSKARTTVTMEQERLSEHSLNLVGRNIDIQAVDLSRLAARAGGVSVSMGSSVGVGLGGSKIKSGNVVSAVIGDNTQVTGASFNMNAEKKEVTEKDYKNLLDMRGSGSRPVKYSKKDADGKEYKADVNLSASKLLKLYDGVNKYTFQNNYAEGIGASAELTSGLVSVGGSFAVIQTENRIKSALGEGVKMNVGGDVTMKSTDRATNRMIAGGLSISPSSASVGAAVTVMHNKDTADVEIDSAAAEETQIDAGGDITLASEVGGKAQAFTAGMSMAISVPRQKKDKKGKPITGKDGKPKTEGGSSAIAGAVNYIVNQATATTATGYGAKLNGGKTALTSKADNDMMALAANSTISIGFKGSAAGASANIITDKTGAYTTIGGLNKINAGSVEIGSDASSQLITGVASQAAQATGDGSAIAAGFNVNHSGATAETAFLDDGLSGNNINASEGDIDIRANADAWALTAAASLPGGVGKALGGSANVNFFDRRANILAPNTSLKAEQGNLRLQSSGKDTTYMLGALLMGSVTGTVLGGNFSYLKEDNDIRTELSGRREITAGRNVLIESRFVEKTAAAAGTIALANMAPSIGATGIFVTKNNTVKADIGEAVVTAKALDGSAIKNLLNEDVKGIYVGANAKETQYAGAAGLALSAGVNLNAETVTLVNSNNVIADASKAALISHVTEKHSELDMDLTIRIVNNKGASLVEAWTIGDLIGVRDEAWLKSIVDRPNYHLEKRTGRTTWERVNTMDDLYYSWEQTSGGGISVVASDETEQKVLAGSLGFSMGWGIGAAVTTVVSDKTVKALAHDMKAMDDIKVSASNHDDISEIAVSGGVGEEVDVQAGAVIQVLKSRATAHVASDVESKQGGFSLTSGNTATLNNIALTFAGSGGLALAPTAVVTCFKGESNATLGEGTKLTTAKDALIQANGDKTISQNTLGAALSTGWGISGAVNLQIVRDKNIARAEKDTNITVTNGGMGIASQGDFRLRALSGTVGASDKTNIAVNAVVTLLRAQTLAELAGRADVKKDLNVTANSKRDVIDIAGTMSVGRDVGAGVNVLTLVAGAKLDQDAADMLSYGNREEDDKETRTFDARTFMKNLNANNGSASKYYEGDLNGESLEKDLDGNGNNNSQTSVGHEEGGTATFDGDSGYRDPDFDDRDYRDDKNSKGRGEDLGLEPDGSQKNLDTKDVDSAKNLGQYDYNSEYRDAEADKGLTAKEKAEREAARAEALKDAVAARIAETAAVTHGNVNVAAEEKTAIDLVGANISGGTVGVGVTTSVAVLHSNVIGESLGTLSNEGGNVSVEARSLAGDHGRDDTDAEARTKVIRNATNDQAGSDAAESAIRVLGIAVGAGQVGVAVSAAVALTDNVTRAILGGGSVTGSNNVKVNAVHDYGKVIAATGALGVGEVGVAASVAMMQSRGEVTAAIDRGTTVRTLEDDDLHNIEITTHSNVKAMAIAATSGIGLVGINAGVALAKNTMRQNTMIGAGADVFANTNVNLRGTSNMDANAYLLGISAGMTAVSLNAGVADLNARLNTSIGESLKDEDGKLPAYTQVVAGQNISVANDVTTRVRPLLASLAAGAYAMGGNVLLAFNRTESVAKIDNAAAGTRQGDISVLADMASRVEASMANVNVGLIGSAGISVNYADLQSVNHAAVSNSLIYAAKDLNIRAGSGKHRSSSARAQSLAASMGAIKVGLNAGIARNRAYNFASFLNDRDEEMTIGRDLNMSVDNSSTARADLLGLEISAASVAASTVVAMNDANSAINADLKRLKVGNDVNLTTKQTGKTDAGIMIGGGTLLGADASIAAAYGRTNSLIDFVVRRSSTVNNINAKNYASDKTDSNIYNCKFSVIAAQVMYGAAYSRDIFNTNVKLTGDTDENHRDVKGSHVVKGNVKTLTEYIVKSNAVVEPSAGGMPDISIAKVSNNMAIARNTAYAGANFEASKGTTNVDGSVTVNTKGAADTYAEITSARFILAPVSAGSSIARSDLSMVQAATMRAGGTVNVGGRIDVQSVVRKREDVITEMREQLKATLEEGTSYTIAYTDDDGEKNYLWFDYSDLDRASGATIEKIYAYYGNGSASGRSARATAMVGTSGGDPKQKDGKGNKMKLTLLDTAMNLAIANENMTSTAAVLGGADHTEYKPVQSDKGQYVTKTRTIEDIDVVDHYRFKHKETGVVCDPTLDYVHYTDGTSYGRVKEGDKKFVENGKYVFQAAVREHFQYDLGYSNETANKRAQKYTEDFKKYDDPKIFERIPVYATYTEEYEEWEPDIVTEFAEVDVYDLANNHLTAGSMNVFTGVEGDEETAAQARSDGAKTVGFATAGNLNARAAATDSFNVMFEGMSADIKGDASLKVKTQTRANALGYAPGRLTVLSVDTASDARASVGTGNDLQSVGIVIGKGSTLNAKRIDLSAENYGSAKSDLLKGNSNSLIGIDISSVPTNSWYSSVISVGENAKLFGKDGVRINSESTANAESVVQARTGGLAFNFSKMMGKNYVKQINDVDFGNGSQITSHGDIEIAANTNTKANAETSIKGGSFLKGDTVKAQNDIERTARVNFGTNVLVRNYYPEAPDKGGKLTVNARVGENKDSIRSTAAIGNYGAIAIGNARAYNNVDQWAEIIIPEGTKLYSRKYLRLEALSTSFNEFSLLKTQNLSGIYAEATVDSAAGIPLPNGVAKNKLNFNTYIDINQKSDTNPGNKRVSIWNYNTIDILASNRGLTANAQSETTGKGLAGVSNSTARNDATLTNGIWIDKAQIDPGNKINIWAESGGRETTGQNKDKAHFISDAYAKLKGIGKAVSEASIIGIMINQVRTNDEKSVEFKADEANVVHKTTDPYAAIWQDAKAESKIKKILGIPLGKKKEKEVTQWYVWNRCDFCHVGQAHDLTHSEQDTIEKRYKDAFDRSMLPIDTVANEVAQLQKTLSSLRDINRTAVPLVNVTRARFGVEDNTTAGERFALTMQTMLGEDQRIDGDRLNSYQLWTNTATRLDTLLLPNATRLYVRPRGMGMGIEYLAEVFQYDLLNNGREVGFDIVTALTENAFLNPVMPMGDIGSLDFSTGTLMLPAQSEHELYLHEVSAGWVMDKLNEGFLQAMIADSEAANSFALTGSGLPGGAIAGGPVYGGDQEGWKLYWLGDTPETAQNPDQTLIFLMVNEAADEIDAFRTTPNMLDSGEQPVDVSLYLFRDARADMREEERYDMLFFDTPAGEQSLVKLVTDLIDDSELVIHTPLRIGLRGFAVKGAALSAYSLNDHFYVLLDGTKGGASLLDGLYQNTFDGERFESDYMLVEGMASGDIRVTLKKDQPIWPEITGHNVAEDLNGARYARVGEAWFPEDQAPQPTALPEGMRAA